MITVQLFLTAVAPAQTGAAVEMSMPSQIVGPRHAPVRGLILASLAILLWAGVPASAADEPDLIFRRSPVLKGVGPNDKLAPYGVGDPGWKEVACHFPGPKKAASR